MVERFSAAAASLLLALFVAGCGTGAPPSPVPNAAPSPGMAPGLAAGAKLDLTPVAFAALPGWREDRVAEALPALQRSCARIARASAKDDAAFGTREGGSLGRYGAWRKICARLPAHATEAAARDYFERNFQPYRLSDRKGGEALVTGYYAPELTGSHKREGRFQAALLRRPPDLGSRKPYYTRAEIEAQIDKGGALGQPALVLAWVDPIDAFFLQVQGGGRVRFTDGSEIRVGYDGDNGLEYVAIGRVLVERHALAPDNVSMQTIRAWLAAHPSAAKSVTDQNPRYVFFRRMADQAAIGSEGTALTPGRSLAVDPGYIPYGAPIYLAVNQPGVAPVRHLVIAQDSGGGVKGPLRGDLFLGAGSEAADTAGKMRAAGATFVLLPRDETAGRTVESGVAK